MAKRLLKATVRTNHLTNISEVRVKGTLPTLTKKLKAVRRYIAKVAPEATLESARLLFCSDEQKDCYEFRVTRVFGSAGKAIERLIGGVEEV